MCRRILLLVLTAAAVFAQTPSDAMLMIDLENVVWYGNEATDPAKLMTSATVTPLPSNFVYPFKTYLLLADVAAVNGKAAKGTLAARGTWLAFSNSPTPVAQRPIADISRNQILDFLIEMLTPEGAQVGTFAGLGFGSGGAPPGTPPGSAAGNFVVIGGSGAYSGVRGQGATVSVANLRTASAVEDPAYRRVNGGGKWRIGVTLNSIIRPEVVAAYHGSDFSRVSAERPAQSGETLILTVKGMGPTKPVLEPGKVFPGDTFAEIVSPVEVTVNGQPGEVAVKIGWPSSGELYRIDVALPSGLSPGLASLTVSAAWIPGMQFQIPIR